MTVLQASILIISVYIAKIFPAVQSEFEQWCMGKSSESKYFQGRCYEPGPTSVSWLDAEDFCLNQGGYLAVANSDTKRNFLKSPPGDAFHVSYSQDGPEYDRYAEWKWRIPGSFDWDGWSNWAGGEPNQAGTLRRIAILGSNGQFWDAGTNYIAKPLCQFSAIPSKPYKRGHHGFIVKAFGSKYINTSLIRELHIPTTTADASLPCSRHCATNDACVAFSVNPSTGQCRLHVSANENIQRAPATEIDSDFNSYGSEWLTE